MDACSPSLVPRMQTAPQAWFCPVLSAKGSSVLSVTHTFIRACTTALVVKSFRTQVGIL